MLKNKKSCFIFVTLKRWSGRKLLDPTTYHYYGDEVESVVEYPGCFQIGEINSVRIFLLYD